MRLVLAEPRGPVTVLTVNRPETRNAIDEPAHDALAAAYDAALASGARAIVLTGAGDSFLSGGDLRVIAREPFDRTLALCRRMEALLDRFAEGPAPVLAAVNGHAFGGGCEVLVACDYRVAAPSAKLSFRQAAMGVSTGWGGGRRLRRLVPRGVMTRLLLTSEVLSAEAARGVGLVEEVDDDPVGRCVAIGEAIAAMPSAAVEGLRRVIDASDGEDAAAIERDVFATLWGGPDQRAALTAYLRRREQ